MAGKALRSTREDAVEEAWKREREQKRKARRRAWTTEEEARLDAGRKPRKGGPPAGLPQLTPAEKLDVRRRVRPFTLLDYLFRLRIKANYIDVDVFSQGPDSDHAATAFAWGMQDLVSATLLVHEMRLSMLLGPKWVLEEADGWIADHRGLPASEGVAARRAILAAL
ncbi:hypothetical protein [Cellulomonas aerilata]|uniref:hypothetical protein n=1 Tax=Cellulomonas aerilata TaxID=515326 RepID=UPI00164997CA|nr:hypothetical protein [Cellulomonas aerilata]